MEINKKYWCYRYSFYSLHNSYQIIFEMSLSWRFYGYKLTLFEIMTLQHHHHLRWCPPGPPGNIRSRVTLFKSIDLNHNLNQRRKSKNRYIFFLNNDKKCWFSKNLFKWRIFVMNFLYDFYKSWILQLWFFLIMSFFKS